MKYVLLVAIFLSLNVSASTNYYSGSSRVKTVGNDWVSVEITGDSAKALFDSMVDVPTTLTESGLSIDGQKIMATLKKSKLMICALVPYIRNNYEVNQMLDGDIEKVYKCTITKENLSSEK